MLFISLSTPESSAANASSKKPWGIAAAKATPLYAARKTLLTGTDILTDTSQARLDALFACPDHADVHTTWRIYQDLLAAYRE